LKADSHSKEEKDDNAFKPRGRDLRGVPQRIEKAHALNVDTVGYGRKAHGWHEPTATKSYPISINLRISYSET